MTPPKTLVLFDIDGTLLRKAGPHHRQALVDAVRRVTGLETTTENVPVAGMLDRDILTQMLANAGASKALIRGALPEIAHHAQLLYTRSCPNLERKVCPGVRRLLWRLCQRRVPAALVTGNLSRIGWKKMDNAGLRHYFQFGAFAESARDRAGLVKLAVQQARREGRIHRDARISLIGDHPNDVAAAKANGVQSIAVATGVVSVEELARHSPDILVPDLRALDLEKLLG